MPSEAPPPTRPRWLDWLPVISLILIVAGIVFASGGYRTKIDDNDHRLTILETKSDGRDDKLNVINERTARIEAKLEVLTSPDRKVGAQ